MARRHTAAAGRAPQAAGAPRVRRESFQTPGELWLDLRIPTGDMVVESVDGSETHVELEGGDVEESVRVDLRKRGEGHHLVVELERKRFRLFETSGLEVRVRLPHGAHLEVSTASGDVDARGRFGAVKAQLGSGDLRLGDAAGRVELNSGSGDVELGAVDGEAAILTGSGDVRVGRAGGEITVRSGSGDVEIDEAAASATVQTASGDQRLSSVRSGSVTVQSASGDLTIGVRRGTRVRLDARSLSGDTRTDLEAGDEARAEGAADVLELRATTLSGDIRITRA
jgi:DUF4097 and DUF4098 domain-containing protein YvlB